MSPATVNHDLVTSRPRSPWPKIGAPSRQSQSVDRVREGTHIGRVITEEHFQAIYGACGVATMPRGLHVEPKEWWQGLFAFAIATGWRIREILAFRCSDLGPANGSDSDPSCGQQGRDDDVDHLPAWRWITSKGLLA